MNGRQGFARSAAGARHWLGSNAPVVAAGALVLVTFLVGALVVGGSALVEDSGTAEAESRQLSMSLAAPGEFGVAGLARIAAVPVADPTPSEVAPDTQVAPQLAHLPSPDPVTSPFPLPPNALVGPRSAEPFEDPFNPTQEEIDEFMGRGTFRIDCPELEVAPPDARVVEAQTPSVFACRVIALDGFDDTVTMVCPEGEAYACSFSTRRLRVTEAEPVEFELSITLDESSSEAERVSFLGVGSGPRLKTSNVQGWVQRSPDADPAPTPDPS